MAALASAPRSIGLLTPAVAGAELGDPALEFGGELRYFSPLLTQASTASTAGPPTLLKHGYPQPLTQRLGPDHLGHIEKAPRSCPLGSHRSGGTRPHCSSELASAAVCEEAARRPTAERPTSPR